MPFTLESIGVFFAGVYILSCILSYFTLTVFKPVLKGLLCLVRGIGFVFRLIEACFRLLWRILRALAGVFKGGAKTAGQDALAVSSSPASPGTDLRTTIHEAVPACPPSAVPPRPRVLITGSLAGDLFGGLCALIFFGSFPAMFICMLTDFPQGVLVAAVLLALSSIILSLMALRRRRQTAAKAAASQDMAVRDLRDSTML